jgi:glycosyltransferase involved in cell wall biosynthesis
VRILFVCPSSTVFGAEVATLNLLSGLQRKGHALLAVTTIWTDGEFSRRLQGIGVPEVRLPFGTFSKKMSWQAITWTIAMAVRLPQLWLGWGRVCRKFKPDVLVLTNPKQGISVYPWLKLQPAIMIEHNAPPLNAANRWMYKTLARKLRLFVPVSDFQVRNICALGIARAQVRVINNGVFSSDRRDLIDQLWTGIDRRPVPPLRIGIAGQISPHKGHDCLVDAACLLKAREMKFEIRVFGRGNPDYIVHLKKKISDSGLEGNWLWMGYETSADRIYTKMDVCVVPSVFDEPFGMVAVEASAYGVPVVASRRGGLPEAVQAGITGWLIESGDARLLAERLSWFVDNPDKCRDMGRAGQERVFNTFTVEQSAARFGELFKRLVADEPT